MEIRIVYVSWITQYQKQLYYNHRGNKCKEYRSQLDTEKILPLYDWQLSSVYRLWQ